MPRKTAAATAKEKPIVSDAVRVETKRKIDRDEVFLDELQKTKKVFAAAASDFASSLDAMFKDTVSV